MSESLTAESHLDAISVTESIIDAFSHFLLVIWMQSFLNLIGIHAIRTCIVFTLNRMTYTRMARVIMTIITMVNIIMIIIRITMIKMTLIKMMVIRFTLFRMMLI